MDNLEEIGCKQKFLFLVLLFLFESLCSLEFNDEARLDLVNIVV